MAVDGGVTGVMPNIRGFGPDARFKTRAGVNRGTTGQRGDYREVGDD